MNFEDLFFVSEKVFSDFFSFEKQKHRPVGGDMSMKLVFRILHAIEHEDESTAKIRQFFERSKESVQDSQKMVNLKNGDQVFCSSPFFFSHLNLSAIGLQDWFQSGRRRVLLREKKN